MTSRKKQNAIRRLIPKTPSRYQIQCGRRVHLRLDGRLYCLRVAGVEGATVAIDFGPFENFALDRLVEIPPEAHQGIRSSNSCDLVPRGSDFGLGVMVNEAGPP